LKNIYKTPASEVDMTAKHIAPYGSWKSPIQADHVSTSGSGWGGLMREIQMDGKNVFWILPKPQEGGRNTLMQRSEDGSITEILPADYDICTRVHEYGGGDYCVHEGTIIFSNGADQRLYRLSPNSEPVPLTSAPPSGESWRYADGCIAPEGRVMLCIHERHHSSGAVENEIIAIEIKVTSAFHTIVQGSDFYASPRVSPDGKKIAWLSWDLPRMPWDGTELWVADFQSDGSVTSAKKIAGGEAEWISNPVWSPNGNLFFLSDRSNWSNLYYWDGTNVEQVFEINADIDRPAWTFGYTRYAFLSCNRIAFVFWEDGIERLGLYDLDSSSFKIIDTGFTAIPYITSNGEDELWFLGGNFVMKPSVVRMEMKDTKPEVVYRNASFEFDCGYLSKPQPIDFTTSDDQVAHALYYPPTNKDYAAPSDEITPLIVRCHGGPTSAAHPFLQPTFQYFTSRGFGILDVNYRGSSGYGRSYREALKGKWGIYDTQDCVAAALFLVDRKEVDPERLIMRGASAGGWTTLCALTFHDLFNAGAVFYGVSDAEMLAKTTHKFEMGYFQYLIGPYPDERQLYIERSPIHHTDGISCPLIVFQGLDDKVVPPSQAEALVKSLQDNKLPHAYLTFPGESHGFRRSDSIKSSLEAELSFYAQLFGFDLADPIEAIKISYLT
jgi:dipeptidyl aminopeptidase/acylaminoacyl peptidase